MQQEIKYPRGLTIPGETKVPLYLRWMSSTSGREVQGVQPKATRLVDNSGAHRILQDRVFETAISKHGLTIRHLRFEDWLISYTYRDVDQYSSDKASHRAHRKALQIPCCHTQQFRMSIQRVTRQLDPFSTSSRHLPLRVAQCSNAAKTHLRVARTTVLDVGHLHRGTCSSALRHAHRHAEVTAVSRSTERSAGVRQCALLILTPRSLTPACFPTAEPMQRSLCAPRILCLNRSSMLAFRFDFPLLDSWCHSRIQLDNRQVRRLLRTVYPPPRTRLEGHRNLGAVEWLSIAKAVRQELPCLQPLRILARLEHCL
jgi:hypothetical protein